MDDDESEVIGVVITDLSERRSKEQAQEAVRMRDEFLSIASHELRTPLSTLVLHLGLGERLIAQPNPGRLEQTLRKAKDQADRMTELINRLLDVTRIASGKLELELASHDLGEIVLGIVEQVSEEAKKRVAISSCRSKKASSPVAIASGSNRPSSMSFPMRSNTRPAIRSRSRSSVAVLKRWWWSKIAASASSPTRSSRIFNRFERASATTQSGLGLGLFIAREIVMQHGGTIRAERRRGGGSRFCVVLPLSKQKIGRISRID